VVASSNRVVLHRHRAQAQIFNVVWRATGVANRPWFVCTCGRRVRRMYSCDDDWACRHCHKLTYASHVMPDKRHWTGAGAVLRLLHELGSDSVDPFTPLPARRPGTWRKRYDRLARAFRVAQERFLHSLADVPAGPVFPGGNGGSEIAIGEPIGEGIGKPLRLRIGGNL
jgi:hypothetical protein